jgi:hypothetical protein
MRGKLADAEDLAEFDRLVHHFQEKTGTQASCDPCCTPPGAP